MRTRRVVAYGIASLMLSAVLLSGCGGKDEPKPNASGYYEGPMKPKGENTRSEGTSTPAGTGQGQ